MITSETTPRIGWPACFSVLLCLATLLLTQAQGSPIPSADDARGAANRVGQADPAQDIERLKEEVRQLKELIKEMRGQNKAIENHLTIAPEVEVQKEDYAQARLRFHTRLMRKGPAPQSWKPVKPPAGVSEIEYPSGDLRLKAWVNRPADETHRYPAVLFLHGGFSFDTSDWDETKPYRDAGFIVLTPLLRAENGQPGAFSYYYDEVCDVLAAADYLSKQPYVDAKRLFVAGHSVGGTMTLYAALASRRFCAAAAFSGGPYFIDRPDLPFDKSDPREILLRSPIAYAGSVKCPLRLYYGTEEASFFGPMNQRFAALAKRHGLNVEALEIEGNHGSHVRWSIPQSIVFFQKVAAQENAPWKGEIVSLPKASEIDLGEGVRMKFVRIEPGKFQMGSPPEEMGRRDDEAQHEVEITQSYCLGIYEVTQAQFRQVMGRKPSYFSLQGDGWEKVFGLNTDDFPVESVSWDEARDFCRIVSMLPEVRNKGWIVDLPTEAEWEYACRAGTETPFSFGSALSSQQANFDGNNPYGGAAKGEFLNRSTKVGSYAPNAWGLFDMQGNVLEWCKDSYDKNYRNKDQKDASERVTRGGLWLSGGRNCRAAFRQPVSPSTRASGVGFRVVVRFMERKGNSALTGF